MTLSYVGSLSLAVALPAPTAAATAGATGINLALPDVQARLDALLAFSPSPIDFAVSLDLAHQIVASISQAIALGIVPPSLAAQIAEVSAIVSSLVANVAAVNTQLGIILEFQSLLTAAGVHVYAFEGEIRDLGREITVELATNLPGGNPSDVCHALVIATAFPDTWSAMTEIFKVSP